MSGAPTTSGPGTLLEAVRADLEAHFGVADHPVLVAETRGDAASDEAARELRAAWDDALPPDGFLLLPLARAEDDRSLAAWRNALWPWLHLVGFYRSGGGPLERQTLGERRQLDSAPAGTVAVLRRSQQVLSPDATAAKFDRAAVSWNGRPGSPGYPHYRWMRRFVGCFADVAPGARILDFGCGTGWVGIEAALRTESPELCAFDPSPQMVEIARENARREGVERFTGRVGFGDDPPFPAEGEAPFDLVISSGVLSFAPDFERWMEGLLGTTRPGGTLVLGDIDPTSRGMRRRRRGRPLVPVRELNSCSRARARQWLEERGLVHERTAGYQLTDPVPQAMHVSETKLAGALSRPLLWLNRGMAGLDVALGGRIGSQFDSWVMRFRVPE